MIKNSVAYQPSQVISHHTFANVVQNAGTNQKSLVATVSFAAGDIICKFSAGITQSFATYKLVQAGILRLCRSFYNTQITVVLPLFFLILQQWN